MSGPTKRKNTIGINNSDNLVIAADEDAEGNDSSMRFRVDGEEQVRLQGGNVGIKTDSPINCITRFWWYNKRPSCND